MATKVNRAGLIAARFILNAQAVIIIQLIAQIGDQACPVNLTNHAYFNLDAHHSDARQHRLQLHADSYLPVDSDGIPNAPLKAVAGTSFDFRQAKPVAQDFLADDDQRAVKGYDHAFLLNRRAILLSRALRWRVSFYRTRLIMLNGRNPIAGCSREIAGNRWRVIASRCAEIPAEKRAVSDRLTRCPLFRYGMTQLTR